MIKIGLTGNIGSGKSLVSKIFGTLGVPVYHADAESKKFLLHPGIRKQVAEAFGPDCLDSKGRIDNKNLAAMVFSNPVALQKLNAILHPLVLNDFAQWCTEFGDHPYLILESAIIFETGIEKGFERIIHVTAPLELTIQRVAGRDGISREEILNRLSFQLPEEVKAGRADYILYNDGQQLLIPQVLDLHRKLLLLSDPSQSFS